MQTDGVEAGDNACGGAGPGPVAGASRVRLTAEGQFEVMVEPDDDVAGVIAALRQLPAAARFVEALGDVETTLVFAPTSLPAASAGQHGDLVSFARTVPAGSVGREVVGLTADDLAERLHAAADAQSSRTFRAAKSHLFSSGVFSLSSSRCSGSRTRRRSV